MVAVPAPHEQEWSIQEVARLVGTTSRTLRHYDAIGLLRPSRVGHNGYRWYDVPALLRLQRVLLLRDLGLPLATVARAVEDERDAVDALREHLVHLGREQERLGRQIASVRRTITTLDEGGRLMAEDMFDGFDHTRYREEVEERWGRDAYAAGDAWWRGLDPTGRDRFRAEAEGIAAAWSAAASAGVPPDSPQAQELAARHVAWLTGVPGTPQADDGGPAPEYLLGLGEMYVADPRFAAQYGGPEGAALVRDALRTWVHARS